MFLNAADKSDLKNSKPYPFQTLSPPAYNLATFSVSLEFAKYSNNSCSVFIFPSFKFLKTAFNS